MFSDNLFEIANDKIFRHDYNSFGDGLSLYAKIRQFSKLVINIYPVS